jgi:hypothetical protein
MPHKTNRRKYLLKEESGPLEEAYYLQGWRKSTNIYTLYPLDKAKEET